MQERHKFETSPPRFHSRIGSCLDLGRHVVVSKVVLEIIPLSRWLLCACCWASWLQKESITPLFLLGGAFIGPELVIASLNSELALDKNS